MQQLARGAKVSFSAACAEGLEVYARVKIRDQEETLFEPRMQAMMRREIRSSDDRHVPFEIRNAIASEQTRMIATDMYKRLLAKEGLSQEQIEAKLRKQYNQARINIFKMTPQLTSMLEEYWQKTDNQASRQTGQAADRQAQGEEEEPAGTGGAGTGTSQS